MELSINSHARNFSKARNSSNARNIRDLDNGSISPLILIYFFISLLSIFLIANVTSAYSARRDLISSSESALTLATQELDEFSYYTSLGGFNSYAAGRKRTPIDCPKARLRFALTLDSNVSINDFKCNGYELYAEVSRIEPLTFQIPVLGITAFVNQVEIAATSEYRE